MSLRTNVVSVLVVLAAFAALVAWTWGTWPDVQVDYGREVYAAWRVSAGEVLYRDIAWFNGPLSVELNAFLFRTFGVSLRTLQVANLILVAGTALVCLRLFSRWYGGLAGTLAATLFLAVFALGHGAGLAGYNFVCPYSHELTHGVMLALLGLASLARRDSGSGTGSLVFAGLVLGCTLLTKSEVALAAVFAFACYLASVRATLRRSELLMGLAAFAIPVLVGWVWLSVELGPRAGSAALLAPYRSALDGAVRELPFYRSMSGFDDPVTHGLSLLRSVGLALLFLLPLHAIERFAAGPIRGNELRARVLTAIGAGVLFTSVSAEWVWALRGLPLFLVVAIGWFLFTARFREAEPAKLAYAIFALVLLGKILLRTWALQYGFALAMPGALLVVAVLVGGLPRKLRARERSGVVFQTGALVAVLFFIAAHLERTSGWLSIKNVRVGEGGDGFWTDTRGVDANRALALLGEEPEKSLLVLPEGALLNYLTRRVNPTRYINFLPPEVVLFGEGPMVSDLALSPPDTLVLWHKDTSEYGLPLFGRDYGEVLLRDARSGRRSLLQAGDPPLAPGSVHGIEVLGPASGGGP